MTNLLHSHPRRCACESGGHVIMPAEHEYGAKVFRSEHCPEAMVSGVRSSGSGPSTSPGMPQGQARALSATAIYGQTPLLQGCSATGPSFGLRYKSRLGLSLQGQDSLLLPCINIFSLSRKWHSVYINYILTYILT